jgi:flagellar motor switch/type III secretory pathway protein FliN
MYGIASGELATSLGDPTEPEPTAPEASPRAPAPTPIEESPATPPSTAGVRRALRVKVPVIVTLAMQNIETNKLLSIGPGAIIEFERAYNEPLQLSVNNVPIAMGEAVKVGDHFGLKITAILTPEERKKYFGGKWMY